MSQMGKYKLKKVITVIFCIISVLGCLSMTGCKKDEKDDITYKAAVAEVKAEQGNRNFIQKGWDFITGKGGELKNEQEAAGYKAALEHQEKKESKMFELAKYVIIGIVVLAIVFVILKLVTRGSRNKTTVVTAPVAPQAPAVVPEATQEYPPQYTNDMNSPRF